MNILNITALKELIDNAFADVPRPKVSELSYEGDWENEVITKQFASYIDEEPPMEFIDKMADSIAGLAPKAFVYFLRYYLDYSIYDPNSRIAEFTINHLSSVNMNNKYWIDRCKLLNIRHRQAICSFFYYLNIQKDFQDVLNVTDEGIKIWCENI